MTPAALAPLVGLWSALLAAPVAILCAALLSRLGPWPRALGVALGSTPLMLASGRAGTALPATVAVSAAAAFPWILGFVLLGLDRGRGQAEVALTLGDRPAAARLGVELPMVVPALLAGVLVGGAQGALLAGGPAPALVVAGGLAVLGAAQLLGLHRLAVRSGG